MAKNLDDVQQTVIYIAYDGDGTLPLNDESVMDVVADLEDGPQLRFDAYMAAWARCLDRMKAIIAELYAPVISSVLHRLESIHTGVLPGLPFHELPVLAIGDLSGGSLFLDRLSARLESPSSSADEEDGNEEDLPLTLVTHLYPGDCPNLTSAMKNLVSGFVDRDKNAPKRRPATSLAPYDLGLLQAWYDASEPRPTLLVLLHAFEQIDKPVIQDVLYICSLQAARLPLTFVLALSTPSPLAYLHASLTRATLALLRVYHFAVPSGPAVLDAVLLKTFFDPATPLALLPGPALLLFIQDYHTTHSGSLDVLLSILQLAHLKHYTTTPLSLLAHATPHFSPHPSARELAFLAALLGRLHAPTTASDSPSKSSAKTNAWRAHAHAPALLLQAVDAARASFARHATRTKLGIALLRLVVASLRTNPNMIDPNLTRDKRLARWTGVAFVRRMLDPGDPDRRSVEGLADLLRKLPATELDSVLTDLQAYLDGLSPAVCGPEEAARAQIGEFRRALSDESADEVTVAEWVEAYLTELLQPLEDATPLWDVWYTGLTPFPSELLNPALRPSIISGLSFPHSYTAAADNMKEEQEGDVHNLPDTSILFTGYLRAGRLINVYDWFDHFRVVLEEQRVRDVKGKGKGETEASPSKGKGKAKAKRLHDAEDEGKEEEKWKLSVQARFVRALHELDWLGFVKHTGRGGGGRKGEYVLRTVLGVLE